MTSEKRFTTQDGGHFTVGPTAPEARGSNVLELTPCEACYNAYVPNQTCPECDGYGTRCIHCGHGTEEGGGHECDW